MLLEKLTHTPFILNMYRCCMPRSIILKKKVFFVFFFLALHETIRIAQYNDIRDTLLKVCVKMTTKYGLAFNLTLMLFL